MSVIKDGKILFQCNHFKRQQCDNFVKQRFKIFVIFRYSFKSTCTEKIRCISDEIYHIQVIWGPTVLSFLNQFEHEISTGLTMKCLTCVFTTTLTFCLIKTHRFPVCSPFFTTKKIKYNNLKKRVLSS